LLRFSLIPAHPEIIPPWLMGHVEPPLFTCDSVLSEARRNRRQLIPVLMMPSSELAMRNRALAAVRVEPIASHGSGNRKALH
jgi:hypothetical protein